MLVLVTYDVDTSTKEGRRRLHRIARCCMNYGQRVQNSVFECVVDFSQMKLLKHELESIMDEKHDSIRYYNLGNKWEQKVEHVGAKPTYNPNDVLLI